MGVGLALRRNGKAYMHVKRDERVRSSKGCPLNVSGEVWLTKSDGEQAGLVEKGHCRKIFPTSRIDYILHEQKFCVKAMGPKL